MEIDKNTRLVDLAALVEKAGLRLRTDSRGRLQFPEWIGEPRCDDDNPALEETRK